MKIMLFLPYSFKFLQMITSVAMQKFQQPQKPPCCEDRQITRRNHIYIGGPGSRISLPAQGPYMQVNKSPHDSGFQPASHPQPLSFSREALDTVDQRQAISAVSCLNSSCPTDSV